ARDALGVPADDRLLLIFGGSLGARTINTAAPAAFASAPYRVLHIAGRRDAGELASPGPHYDLRDYLVPFGLALAAADLAVARAGGSIFELAQHGIPAVLVPYPHATADHQAANARWMKEGGAAVVVRDAEVTPERLRAEADAILLDPPRLEAMSAAACRLARPDAAADIAQEVLAAARGAPA
ncbi:MAG TPA: glycosyltransferase, partial [Solirubrobacteraceae bacterium]|nr:glycosyltransferase [Solirubrobacteraceae bacterium]